MRLPEVARRSPAITTPSAYRTATTVVPWVCGSRSPDASGTTGRASARRSSSRKLGPGSSPGLKRSEAMRPENLPERLLPALLDIGLHEVLGVGLQHLVDLVE